MLDKKQILEVSDAMVEAVEVPEWGLTVYVRTLTGTDLDDFEGENYEIVKGQVKVNKRNVRARLLARALCTEEGVPLFTAKDVDALGAKSGMALSRLTAVARRINGLDDKAVEAAEKNLDSGLDEDSTSV
jgi:hypothetical protein